MTTSMLRFTTLLLGLPAPAPLQPSSNPAGSSSQQADAASIRLTDAEARRCLEAVNKVPLLQQRLGVEDQELQSARIEVGLLQSELADTVNGQEIWHKRALADAAQLETANDALEKWYHDPLIMGLLGFTGGVLATSAVVLTSHH